RESAHARLFAPRARGHTRRNRETPRGPIPDESRLRRDGDAASRAGGWSDAANDALGHSRRGRGGPADRGRERREPPLLASGGTGARGDRAAGAGREQPPSRSAIAQREPPPVSARRRRRDRARVRRAQSSAQARAVGSTAAVGDTREWKCVIGDDRGDGCYGIAVRSRAGGADVAHETERNPARRRVWWDLGTRRPVRTSGPSRGR